MTVPLLSVEGLTIELRSKSKFVPAVRELSFSVNRGETLCIVGESGCGKSLSALAVMRLLPEAATRISCGKILLDGENLSRLTSAQMCDVRGNHIGMIFQEPMTSLNPVLTVGKQISEAITAHQSMDKSTLQRKVIELLDLVRIPEPHKRFHEYPHRLSGGMRQRVMIAIAIACNPKLLIADEPTTALDVTIQAEILDLLRSLQKDLGMGLILITHDLGVVAHMAQRVLVMYAGWKVEEAGVNDVFAAPVHPYTSALLSSTISFDPVGADTGKRKEIRGMVPSLFDMPPGCPFEPRCDCSIAACREMLPNLTTRSDGHQFRCLVNEAGASL